MVRVWKTPHGYDVSVGDFRLPKSLTHNTAENFSDLYVDHRLGREEDGGKCDDQSKTGHNRVAIPKTFRYPAVDEEANDFTDVGTL
jgi:hypothetical protein